MTYEAVAQARDDWLTCSLFFIWASKGNRRDIRIGKAGDTARMIRRRMHRQLGGRFVWKIVQNGGDLRLSGGCCM